MSAIRPSCPLCKTTRLATGEGASQMAAMKPPEKWSDAPAFQERLGHVRQSDVHIPRGMLA